jgi:hypothetical protein
MQYVFDMMVAFLAGAAFALVLTVMANVCAVLP